MFSKIVSAVDGSDNSQKALDLAAQLASQNKADLHIISVIEPISNMYPLGESYTYNEVHEKALNEYYQKIHAKLLQELKEKYPELKVVSEIKTGKPADLIVGAAGDADLIVIGHRGHGALLTWVLGSVARQVVDKCSAPVLVVKDKDYCSK